MKHHITDMESSEAHQIMTGYGDVDTASVVASTFAPTGISTPHTESTTDFATDFATEFATERFWGDVVLRDAVPQAGDTFIIVDKAYGRAITVIEGRPKLETSANRAGSWRWLCTEKDGFLGFRNTVSGRYLGHNIWWNMVVDGMSHKGWEHFHARRQEGGGYTLLAPDWFTMRQISIGESNTLIVGSEGGTVWEFIKVLDD